MLSVTPGEYLYLRADTTENNWDLPNYYKIPFPIPLLLRESFKLVTISKMFELRLGRAFMCGSI